VLGASLLWFGWYGFNGGSALTSVGTPSAALAMINTTICTGTALISWCFADWLYSGKPSLVGACIGSVAGLVFITPSSGYIQPYFAFVGGVIVTVGCYGAIILRKRFLSRFVDDALDVWGCHGVGGFLGAICVGILADPISCNPFGNWLDPIINPPPTWCAFPGTSMATVNRGGTQFGKQLAAAIICSAYCTIMTPLILAVIGLPGFITGWRSLQLSPPIEDELGKSVDEHLHGEIAYHSPPKSYTASGTTISVMPISSP